VKRIPWLANGPSAVNMDSFSREKGCLFVHVPKAAGRSILAALGVGFRCEHKTIAEYCALLGEDEVRKRFKFTCVRNPWERAVSWYRFFGGMGPPSEQVPFDVWLKRVHNRRSRIVGERKFPLDQSSYVKTGSGEVLMDVFLRFESLDNDWPAVAARLGALKELPHVGGREQFHRSPALPEDYREFYTTSDLIKIVAELDAETIARFNYTFE
jgi:hypothetical protein